MPTRSARKSSRRCRFCGSRRASHPASRMRCLADYIAPKSSGVRDYIGAFAVTSGIGIEEHVARFEKGHDDYSSIMLKALADRLAEACAEHFHERVRREWWGYAGQEALTNQQLIREEYHGHSAGAGLPGLPGSHREVEVVGVARCGAQHRHSAYGVVRHVSDRGGEWVVHRASDARGTSRSGRSIATRCRITRGAKDFTVPDMEKWLSPNLGYDP